jgi:N6-adenosine-specific RNA methylase IME4
MVCGVQRTHEPRSRGLLVRYRTIVADPPWEIGAFPPNFGYSVGKPVPYETMTVEDIAALPVRDLSERNAHLYLWTINAYIEDAYQITRDWGFKPIRLLTWTKPPHGIGLGGTFVSTTEFVLFSRRGTLASERRVETSWFHWPRGKHSSKPEAFLDLVESVSPGPYLELFARRQRLGWDTWGHEALEHVEMGGAA